MTESQVVVRMYNVGFGDCFLVMLPTTDGLKRVLIDCGTHPASTGPRQARRDAMPQLFADLEKEAGGRRLDVVVATHRHKDHISAFAAPDWKDVSVKEVWMPWTEDPNDPDATRIRERMKLAMVGLLNARRGLQALADPALAVGARMAVASDLIDNNDEFVDDEIANEFQLAIKNERSMETLWNGFAGNPKREYLSIEHKVIETPVLPGVRIHVLGPSKDEKVIRDLEPPPAETFAHLEAPNLEGEVPKLPFEEGWARSLEDVGGNAAFNHLRIPGQIVGTIRQLAADDLLAAAASIESSINGTSLMLVIEVGGLFLFFPGDAQWGTWDMVLENPEARRLLEKVSFYKIGHHGSHNATPRTFIKDVMAADALAAVPVAPVAVWPRIPLADLVAEMKTLKQIRLVRSDMPDAEGPIANVTIRDDISVDFAFDLPEAAVTASAEAPAPTTGRRRAGARATAARRA
jgi:beta-lactamase superfamily II metal-dependent hydrolase